MHGEERFAMRRKQIFVNVAEAYRETIDDVAHLCHRSGMQISGVLERMGVILGSADAESMEALSGLKGVAEVVIDDDLDNDGPGPRRR
jgi:hypothetical protein